MHVERCDSYNNSTTMRAVSITLLERYIYTTVGSERNLLAIYRLQSAIYSDTLTCNKLTRTVYIYEQCYFT